MKFNEFLLNEDRNSIINLDSIVDMYLKNCKKTSLKNYLIRSVKHGYSYVLSDSGKSESNRTLKGGDYLSTIMVDHMLELAIGNGAPKRRKSIIMATQGNIKHVDSGMFGSHKYHVIPFDDAPLAYLYNIDFNYSIKLSNIQNKWRKYVSVLDDTTYDDIIKSLESNKNITPTELAEILDIPNKNIKTYDDVLTKTYNLDDIDVSYTYGGDNITRTMKSEVWSSGKCLLIHSEKWDEFVNAVNEKKGIR